MFMPPYMRPIPLAVFPRPHSLKMGRLSASTAEANARSSSSEQRSENFGDFLHAAFGPYLMSIKALHQSVNKCTSSNQSGPLRLRRKRDFLPLCRVVRRPLILSPSCS